MSPLKNHRRIGKVGLFLAVRSLTRGSIGTSIMTIVMMSLIFVNLIFLTSIIDGLVQTAYAQIIQTLTGHVIVEPGDGDTYITNSAETEKNLRLIPGVRAISARTNFTAEIEHNGEQGSYRGVAINPDDEAAVTLVEEHIVEGRYLEPDETDAVILGRQIAGGENVELYAYSLKNAAAGDTIDLHLPNGQTKEYMVAGIFDNNFVQSDNRFFITNTEYESIFPQLANNTSEFALQLDDAADLHATTAIIVDRFPELNALTWEDTAGVVESFTESFSIVNVIVSLAAIVVAGITIFIVMYIDVVHRRKQIGILRAIGISETSIAISYILRAMLYALIGIILGITVFQFAITPIFTQKPLHLPVGDVSLSIEQTILSYRGAALFVVAFLGAYIPIQKILKIDIIEAIWGD